VTGIEQPPKPHLANLTHLADFAELECLRRGDGNVSIVDLVRIMEREDDGNRQTRDHYPLIQDAFAELQQRAAHCGSYGDVYPYRLLENGSTLEVVPHSKRRDPDWPVYYFLLFATRLDMRTEKHQAGHDGTVLFERLCKEVAERFWGGPAEEVGSCVFGTGREVSELGDEDRIDARRFAQRINELCKKIGEGIQFQHRGSSPVTAKDGRLDIVVWKDFADKRQGKLIGFGQCKTGTHWENDLTKLQASDFCRIWMRDTPAVPPARLYFVADRVVDRWYHRSVDGGIIFDRCRVVEYAYDLPPALKRDILTWIKAVAARYNLRIP